MSLKKLILLLLIANLAYFVYSQGWLHMLTGGDTSQREPERLMKQINPEAILVKPTSASSDKVVADPVNRPPNEACSRQREQWMVYMGPHATEAANTQKRAELKQLGIASTEVSKPTLKLGLSLGQFDTEALARQTLKRLDTKGIGTATVLLWGVVDEPCKAL